MKMRFLHEFWFYIKEELKEGLILHIKENSFTNIFQGICLEFKNIVFQNPSQWLFPK